VSTERVGVRWRPGRSTVVLAASPAIAGVAAAVPILIVAPHLDLGIWITLWGAVLALGCGVTAALALVLWLRVRIAGARKEGAEEEQRVAIYGHHQFLFRLDHELKNPVTAIQAGLANLSGLMDGSRNSEASTVIDSRRGQV
jgi:two-component system, OmpR family, sensor kinase